MQYDNITTERGLIDFCDSISSARSIAFDTEFVSEDSYRPDLCLIQVAVAGRLAVIDTHSVDDITPFWRLLVSPGHETVVHAGREELRFCLRDTGQRPHNLFDVQIAAALVGLEYPASYGNLIYRVTGKSLGKGETRTNWRHRPLSQRQIEYALQDVVDLEQLRDWLAEQIEKLGRWSWLEAEMATWQEQVEASDSEERWRRVAGTSSLSRRSLAIVRELWQWREGEAERRNRPVKRILRDDLIVELAKRQTADLKRIQALRGLERGDLQIHLNKIANAIERALALPESHYPRQPTRSAAPQVNLLCQFLSTALGSICRSAQVAPSLVGTANDVRELIAYRLGLTDESDTGVPALAKGWRADVVGHTIEELLSGNLSIRITDPLSDHPLAFEGDAKV